MVSERAGSSVVVLASVNALACSWFFTKERVSEPMMRKFCALDDAGSAVVSWTRGIFATSSSMYWLARKTARAVTSAHSTTAMRMRAEKPRSQAKGAREGAREGELTVRSWYRGVPEELARLCHSTPHPPEVIRPERRSVSSDGRLHAAT